MELTDPKHTFTLLSVIELHLAAQNTMILPRPHSTLSYRTQGNALIEHHERQFSLETDDILFVPAGCSYHITSAPEIILCINLAISDSDHIPPEHFTPQNKAVFADAFHAIYDIWCAKKPGYYQKCMSILYTILHHLEKQCSQIYRSSAFLSIKGAINYMHTNFTNTELSVSSLCQIANLSDTQFRRNFYEVYSTTPLKYLQTLRVNYAADLLSGSLLSIEDISVMSGFTDSKYFCSVFKKYKSVPPSVFRKSL